MRRAPLYVLATAALSMAAFNGLLSAQSTPPAPAPAGRPAATQPASRPTPLPADQLLSQMLLPTERARRPLVPQATETIRDATSGKNATAPDAPTMTLLREGSFVVDRTGRLTRSPEGSGMYEFTFDADGRTLRDPPLLILPNRRLESMEEMVKSDGKDIRFRVTGVVTEYRGRNGILIEKAVRIADALQPN